MSVMLSPRAEAMIEERLAGGRYRDVDEVIEEALLALDERERDDQKRLETLRAKLQIGIDQLDRGESVLFTPELAKQIRQEAHERFLRGELPDPDVCP